MATSNPLKLILVFGVSGLAALTPDLLGSTVPSAYVGAAGLVVALAYGILHYLEQKADNQTQETFLQAIEAIIEGQIPNIAAAVSELTQKTSPMVVVAPVAPPAS